MGKQPGPSPEELEFIFECFTRGLSDREVLDEMQDTEFPFRNPRFVRDRRKEFNAARKVLETTLKQQADPSLAKAKEEHHEKIRAMVEKWLEVFPSETPLFDQQYDEDKRMWMFGLNNLPLEVNGVCNDSFFKVVREHLQSKDFWKEYSDWENMWAEVVDTCEKVREKIGELRKQVEAWSNILEIGRDFEIPISQEITQRQFGTAYISTLHLHASGEWLYGYFEDPEGEKYLTSKVILRASHPEDCIKSYEALIANLLNSAEVVTILKLSIDLYHRQIHIRQALEDILIRHVWVSITCKWCPGQ